MVLGVGADAAVVDASLWHIVGEELEAVGQGEVDVVLLLVGVPLGNLLHGEASLLEGLVHLDAYLEGGEGDAGAYDGLHMAAAGAIGAVHDVEHLRYDASYRATPAGMDGGYDTVDGIVEEDGNAVGR